MQRLEENRDVEQRKREALGGSSQQSNSKKTKPSSGYQLFHLIFVALLSLLIGAIFQSMQAVHKENGGVKTGDEI
jgi:uncharacterized membrane protein